MLITSAHNLSYSTVVKYIPFLNWVVLPGYKSFNAVRFNPTKYLSVDLYFYIPLTYCRHPICTKVKLRKREENEKSVSARRSMMVLNKLTTLNKGSQQRRISSFQPHEEIAVLKPY